MGGAELGIYEIFRRLGKKHEIQILTPYLSRLLVRDFGMVEPQENFSQTEIIRFKDWLNLKDWRGHWKLKGIIPPFSLSALRAANRQIKVFCPDLVNVFYPLPTGLTAVFLEKIKKIPVVLSYPLFLGKLCQGHIKIHLKSNFHLTILPGISSWIRLQ